MNDWNPQLLTECVGSEFLGWTSGMLAMGMVIWYLMIAKIWYRSMKLASHGGRVVWGWLIAIFLISMVGYASWMMALFVPKLAVMLRIAILLVLNIACPIFWSKAKKFNFTLMGVYEDVGYKIIGRAMEYDTMSDHEVASVVRELVINFLARKVAPSA